MFTGIVEAIATIVNLTSEGSNLRLTLETPLATELRIDQSVAHNGVCLTVERAESTRYEVVAIAETLTKTNLGDLQLGDAVNLERCLRVDARLDGHMVQGHVDRTLRLLSVDQLAGSWLLHIELPDEDRPLVVPRGSISLNGVSLTVAELADDHFTVAIIPYTWTHTNLSRLAPGHRLNAEYDLLGKYIVRWLELRAG
jgi:riboflavin synthase